MRKSVIALFLCAIFAALAIGIVAVRTAKTIANAELVSLRLIVRADFASAVAKQLITEATVPPGAALLFGDSLIANLPTKQLIAPIANFGIPGAVTAVTLHRMQLSRLLSTARVVVLQGGVNDLGIGPSSDALIENNMRQMLTLVPQSVPVVMLAIFPVVESDDAQFSGYNARIHLVNLRLANVCTASLNCRFLDLTAQLAASNGELRDELRKDSVHYNLAGGDLVASALAKVMN